MKHTITLLSALWLAPLAPLAPLAAADAQKTPDRKPNIVFILADDLGWKDTSLYGSKFCETPNLEKLAKRGMMFTQAYAANPLCSPTRASIMTGLYPGRVGITQPNCHLPPVHLQATLAWKPLPHERARQVSSATRLNTEYYTLAEALHDANYATGHFGKWHLGQEPYSPLQQGFDVDVPHTPGPGPAGSYLGPWKFPAFIGKPGEHIEDRMATEAITFIRANQDKPFFLNYWAFSVHAPFDGKADLIKKYAAKADPNDPQRCPIYGAMVQSLDENVGRLIDVLDELKLTENTIIVFFSDNGGNMYDRVDGIPPTSNAPLRGGKATIYEGGTREPCVVVWPGKVKPGSQNDALLSSVDWYPTILDMTGVTPKQAVKFDGVSQTPALLGTGTPRDTAFCFFPHYTPATGAVPSVWVRRGDWKLIRFFCDSPDQTDRFELYHLKEDLAESKNLAAEHPDKVKEFDALIRQHLKDINAVIPVKNPGYDPAAKMPEPGQKPNQPKTAAPKPKGAFKDIRQELEKAGDPTRDARIENGQAQPESIKQ
ncbi:MAG: sulfatase [Akkermansiaceae bacterium]|nr:sulfatase [Akkermansiaceae bacterium]